MRNCVLFMGSPPGHRGRCAKAPRREPCSSFLHLLMNIAPRLSYFLNFRGGLRVALSQVERFEVEVIWIRRCEPTTPTAAHRFPPRAEEGPELGRRERSGEIAHSKVNRQSRTSCVEGRRRKRIDVNLEPERSVA